MTDTKAPHSLEGRLLSATRAMSGQKDVTFAFSANALPEGLERTTTLLMPPLPDAGMAAKPKPVPPKQLAELRGEADLAALLLRHHRCGQHAASRPANPVTGLLFDRLEQVRVEAVAARRMEGTRANLQARLHRAISERSDLLPMMNDQQATLALADAAPLLLREALSEIAPPEALAHALRHWRPALEPIFARLIDPLRRALNNQTDYTTLSQTLMRELALVDPSLKDVSLAEGNASGPLEPTATEISTTEMEDDDAAMDLPSGVADDGAGEETAGDEDGAAQTEADGADTDSDGTPQARKQLGDTLPDRPNQPKHTAMPPPDAYRIWRTEFDEVARADQLIPGEELTRLRKQLDQRLAPMQGLANKLAAKLQRLLLAQQHRSWESEQEEGELDARRLSRLIADPNWLTPYQREKVSDLRDTVIALLIDNSGSMRGRPITLAAMSADILSQSLERCGVKSEILGFTTREWKGGDSRKSWIAAGQPHRPGRLNDLRHIVYKSADQRAASGRRNLALMLRDGILKENIDGEAILWAHDRLVARPETRRILMVISDGAPVDDATLSANDVGYLDAHLRATIKRIEDKSAVELIAIGIGHDVTRYYKRAVTLSDPDQLGETLIGQVLDLFTVKTGRKAA